MNDKKKKILLAVNSPLLAPLYAAMVRNRNKVFDHVEFEYRIRKSRDTVHDPLMKDVQSKKFESKPYIAAVGDPFRALQGSPEFEDPFIVGGVIQHMFYYLIGPDADHRKLIDGRDYHNRANELPLFFEKWIIQPKYMSGYAIAGHHLKTRCGLQTASQIDDILFTNTTPGYEERYFKHFERCRRVYRRPRPYLYMTTNPLVETRLPKGFEILWDYSNDPPYRNTLMTCVVVGRETYEQDASARQMIDGVMECINLAIDDIYDDPVGVAIDLKKYQDDFISFSPEHITHSNLVGLLRLLAVRGAYPRGGKVLQSQVSDGIKMRAVMRQANPDREYLVPLEEFESKIAPTVLATTEQTAAAKISYPIWLEGFVDDHYRTHVQHSERDGFWSIALLALPLALTAIYAQFEFPSSSLVPSWLSGFVAWLQPLPFTAFTNGKLLAVVLCVVSLLFTLSDWRLLSNKVKLSLGRTVPLFFATIVALLLVGDLVGGRDVVIGAIFTLGVTLAIRLFNYHKPEVDRAGRLWPRLKQACVVRVKVMLARPPLREIQMAGRT